MLTVMMLKFSMNLDNIIIKNTFKFQVPSYSGSKDIDVLVPPSGEYYPNHGRKRNHARGANA